MAAASWMEVLMRERALARVLAEGGPVEVEVEVGIEVLVRDLVRDAMG